MAEIETELSDITITDAVTHARVAARKVIEADKRARTAKAVFDKAVQEVNLARDEYGHAMSVVRKAAIGDEEPPVFTGFY